jgi:hypothetical protein
MRLDRLILRYISNKLPVGYGSDDHQPSSTLCVAVGKSAWFLVNLSSAQRAQRDRVLQKHLVRLKYAYQKFQVLTIFQAVGT